MLAYALVFSFSILLFLAHKSGKIAAGATRNTIENKNRHSKRAVPVKKCGYVSR